MIKKSIIFLIVFCFHISIHSQEDRKAIVYDITRPNSKTTAQINTMSRMVEGSEAWNTDTNTIWRYVLGAWIDTGTTGGTTYTFGNGLTETAGNVTLDYPFTAAVQALIDANTLKNTYPAADAAKVANVPLDTNAELAGKVDDSQVLTDVPAGAVFTDTQLTQEQVEDFVDGVIVGGTNTTVTYDDALGTITIDASSGGLNQEQIEDFIGNTFLVSGNNLDSVYDDSLNTYTLNLDAATIALIAANTAKNSYPAADANKVSNLPANQNAINADIETRTAINDAKVDTNTQLTDAQVTAAMIAVNPNIDLDETDDVKIEPTSPIDNIHVSVGTEAQLDSATPDLSGGKYILEFATDAPIGTDGFLTSQNLSLSGSDLTITNNINGGGTVTSNTLTLPSGGGGDISQEPTSPESNIFISVGTEAQLAAATPDLSGGKTLVEIATDAAVTTDGYVTSADFTGTTTKTLTLERNGLPDLTATFNDDNSGGGQVNSIVAGTDITVDNTDPVNPIINYSGGSSVTQTEGTTVMTTSGFAAAEKTGNFVWVKTGRQVTGNLYIADVTGLLDSILLVDGLPFPVSSTGPNSSYYNNFILNTGFLNKFPAYCRAVSNRIELFFYQASASLENPEVISTGTLNGNSPLILSITYLTD